MADEKKTEEVKNDEKAPTTEELTARVKQLEAELSSVKQTSSQAITKANAEAADWKRQYRETLDESTRKAQEAEEHKQAVEAELKTLKTEKRVASYHSKLMAAGYDDATAKTMAATLPDGIDETFFEGQKAFLASLSVKAKTEGLNSQPGLSAGTPPNKADAEAAEIAKIMQAAGLK